MKIQFIYDRWKHHASHSGYDQIVFPLGERFTPLDYDNRGSRIIPWRLVNQFVYKNSGITHYGHPQFYTEFSAALSMVRNRSQIYHFLYGDFDYRYLGFMNGLNENRLVASYHLPPDRLDELVTKHSHFRKLSAIFVVSSNQVPYFTQFVEESKVHCVPHGIDISFFHPAPRVKTEAKRRCLFVGRHLRDLETFKKVIELFERDERDIETVIVGGGEGFDKEFAHHPGVVMKSGISDEDLLHLYQTSDVLLLPLLDATAVNSLLEAMACGLPCVVTGVGGIWDYTNASCSLIVPPQDAEAMYSAAIQLLEDEVLWQNISRKARDRAKEFDWANVITQIRDIYQNIL